jgi:hypothetical protein
LDNELANRYFEIQMFSSILYSCSNLRELPMPSSVPDSNRDHNGSTPLQPTTVSTGRRSPASNIATALVLLCILGGVGYGCYRYIFDGIRPSGPAGNIVAEPDPVLMRGEYSPENVARREAAEAAAAAAAAAKAEKTPDQEVQTDDTKANGAVPDKPEAD